MPRTNYNQMSNRTVEGAIQKTSREVTNRGYKHIYFRAPKGYKITSTVVANPACDDWTTYGRDDDGDIVVWSGMIAGGVAEGSHYYGPLNVSGRIQYRVDPKDDNDDEDAESTVWRGGLTMHYDEQSS